MRSDQVWDQLSKSLGDRQLRSRAALGASSRQEATDVLSDLTALTPPALMAAAFLVALGAFLRHEMRGRKNRAEDALDDVEEPSRTDDLTDRR